MKALHALLACLLVAAAAFGDDWPQFGGPHRDNKSAEKGLLKEWPKDGPALAWTFDKTGLGYSPPTIVGGRLYILGTRDKAEYLFALDATKGTELWKLEIGPIFDFKGNVWGGGPRSSASVADGRVFALGGNGNLVCADAKEGKKLWSVHMQKDLKGEVNPIYHPQQSTLGWGYCWSPLVDGDRLIVFPGGPDGALAALNCKTGEVVWRSKGLEVQASYASPVVAEIAGVKQYIILTNEGLHGVDTAGKPLWSYIRKPEYNDCVINTPIVHDDLVYATVGLSSCGCDLVKVEKADGKFTTKQLYKNKAQKLMKNKQGGVVLLDGKVYGSSERRGWVCQDLKTGEADWADQAMEDGSVIYADGHLYCFTEDKGTVALVEATPKEFKVVSQFTFPKRGALRSPKSLFWAPPVIANGQLYLRDQELLFCYKIK